MEDTTRNEKVSFDTCPLPSLVDRILRDKNENCLMMANAAVVVGAAVDVDVQVKVKVDEDADEVLDDRCEVVEVV